MTNDTLEDIATPLKAFLLVAEDEDPNCPNIDLVDPTPDPTLTPDSNLTHLAQISLNSLSSDLASETLHLADLLSSHRVVLLVDGGSTHNFLQPQLAIFLSLPCQTAPTPLHVMFFHHGHFVDLQGENATTSSLLPQHQFCHLCRNNEDVSYFHIYCGIS